MDLQGYAFRSFPGCIIQEAKKWQRHPQVLAAQRRCRKECELQSRHLAAVLQYHQKAAKQGGREYHPDIIPKKYIPKFPTKNQEDEIRWVMNGAAH